MDAYCVNRVTVLCWYFLYGIRIAFVLSEPFTRIGVLLFSYSIRIAVVMHLCCIRIVFVLCPRCMDTPFVLCAYCISHVPVLVLLLYCIRVVLLLPRRGVAIESV